VAVIDKNRFIKNIRENAPEEVLGILEVLSGAGFDAYLVGGFVRDLLLGEEIDDYDITTNATPEQIQEVFPHSYYNNNFFTVGVITNIGEIHVTTYRIESTYSDKRHPEKLSFAASLREDVERRDFTINALAVDMTGKVYDYVGGVDDAQGGVLRAVGNAEERFNEDALRILRAVRFSARLNFTIEEKTKCAIKRSAHLLGLISTERIRDEIVRMIDDRNAHRAIRLLDELDILIYILPELVVCKDVQQNKHHIYDVFNHLVNSLKHCPSSKFEVKFAALLHDIGKPQTKGEKDGEATFYGHEFMSEKIAKNIMSRLRFPKDQAKYIQHLVRNHMFFYDENVTDSGVRRALKRIRPEHLEDFIDLRVADRLGSGTKNPKSWRLLEFEKRAFEVRHHPISDHDLNVSGSEIIEHFNLKPGKIIGEIKNHLLSLVIESPERNSREFLLEEAARYLDGNPTQLEITDEQLEQRQKELLVQDF
jgi:poly(A) polymerase/tRNA nucleotidyltransferase (CCA-adding enzyme)